VSNDALTSVPVTFCTACQGESSWRCVSVRQVTSRVEPIYASEAALHRLEPIHFHGLLTVLPHGSGSASHVLSERVCRGADPRDIKHAFWETQPVVQFNDGGTVSHPHTHAN
jgi:hypothetical protein